MNDPLTARTDTASSAWPQLFFLYRKIDFSGVSGEGVVAFGTRYPCGKITLCWNSDVHSVTTFDSIEQVEQVHGHAGGTVIVWAAASEWPPIPTRRERRLALATAPTGRGTR